MLHEAWRAVPSRRRTKKDKTIQRLISAFEQANAASRPDPNDSGHRLVRQEDWENLARQVRDAVAQCEANKNALDSSTPKRVKKKVKKKAKKKA